ncbi:hypothetical protein MSG28_003675 [Choristoneura fumiferana]|uniref:Uncharacterized protein n=1 Tax=Choristoneura fumiferana TaxID=7141 RepID=A0ACC0KGI2_CHOFU|nr:hypothetical protein MSG28_003675 [Choristoneura fumiferana]
MMISRSKHRSAVEVCADCGASDPSWASINRGLLLCAECCSVHRSMGRHISHVKSLRQGSWPPSLLAMVQQLTAQNVNSIWEHSLLDTSAPKHLRKKPQAKDPLHPIKSEFILAKHLRLAYVLRARRDEPVGELGRQLHSAVRSASLDTAMRLLAQGADPNYYHPEKGSTCLHVACRAGQPAQAELLAAWGADPAARDANHLTPHMAANMANERHGSGALRGGVSAALLGVLSPPASRLLRASHASDDEPLYDSVASDDDYAALAPIDLHMSIDPRAGETVSSTYNASLPIEHSAFSDLRPAHSPPLRGGDVDSLKKELDSRDSTITELKNQLKDLQTIVEQLTKENSVLKTTSSVEDNNSLTSQTSITDNVSSNGLDSASKPPERGRSLETDQLTLSSEEADLKQALKSSQRPVSMFEAREGPKNNWHVTKHQGGGRDARQVRPRDARPRRDQPAAPRLAARHAQVRAGVRALLQLFPQTCPDRSLSAVLEQLRAASAALGAACAGAGQLEQLRGAAYDLARATKLLVTHFHQDS